MNSFKYIIFSVPTVIVNDFFCYLSNLNKSARVEKQPAV